MRLQGESLPDAAHPRYIILQLGLAGPILQLARTLFNEAKRIGTDKIREAFVEEVRLEEPQRTEARGRDGDSMRNALNEK